MGLYLDKTGLGKVWEKVKARDTDTLTAAQNYADSQDTTLQNTLNTSITSVNSKVTTLQGYFSSGIAKKATGDKNGNDITTTYIKASTKGVANGVASLDSDGKVPSSQLPSYVDDVIEGYYVSGDTVSKFWQEKDVSASRITGESGKIYVDKDTGKTYRFSGSDFVEISASLALGETSSTAYAGNKGKTNATNIATLQGYFSSGIAKKATGDKNGNDITTTYSTLANTIKSLSISGKTITYTKGDSTTGTLTTQDTVYTLPAATSSALGGVKIGSNISVSSGTISLSKSNVTSALGYTPPTTNTTYSVATTSANGLMSSTDKAKLDGITIDNTETFSSATSANIPTKGAITTYVANTINLTVTAITETEINDICV